MRKTSAPLWTRFLKQRKIPIGASLDGGVADVVVAHLRYLEKQGPRPISLFIDSPGGMVVDALRIVDAVRSLSVPVRTICYREAHGMAALLVAAGTRGRRCCLPEAAFHLVRIDGPWELREEVDRLRATVADLLAALTGRPAAQVAADLDAELHLDADDALRYGLVDKIIAELP